MNNITPEYDDELSKLAETIKKLQKELEEDPDAAEDEIVDGITITGSYERFKKINRLAELKRFHEKQLAEVHEVVRETNGQVVCNCALVIQENEDDPDNAWDLLNAYGHLNNDTGEVVQQFLTTEYPNDNDHDVEYVFFCQLCNNSPAASTDLNELPEANALKEFRKNHVCSN